MKKKTEPKKTPKNAAEEPLTAHSKRKRKAQYYKLSEKDHPLIKKGLQAFVSVYQIAARIGCGYTTLKLYIKNTPELAEVQKDASDNETEWVKSKLMQKIAGGSLGAMCFYLERKAGWTQHQKIENVGEIPAFSFGIIPESELPDDGLGEPVPLVGSAKVEEPQETEADKAEEDRKLPPVTADDNGPAEDSSDDSTDDDWDNDGDSGEDPTIF